MHYPDVTNAEINQAKFPHNLFVTGLFLFDLMMTPAVIVLKIGMVGLVIPLVCSVLLITYIYLRGQKNTSWFVQMHWKLAYTRGLWLLTGYAISAMLILIAWLISRITQDPSMQHILWTALTRIALMPTLILVMVTAVLEASAIGQVTKREIPDKLAASFPPPV